MFKLSLEILVTLIAAQMLIAIGFHVPALTPMEDYIIACVTSLIIINITLELIRSHRRTKPMAVRNRRK